MSATRPYLHPFACFTCRRSFKRSGAKRDEAACPACGSRAVRLSRKFKPPRREDAAQWSKVEALVKLGFRFETLYDADGAIVRYPSSARGIPAFVDKVAQIGKETVEQAAGLKATRAFRRHQREAARTRQRKIR